MIHYKGKDEWGNRVYTVGLGSKPDVACRTLQSMIHLLGDPEEFRFYNALHCLKLSGKVGGALSRRYGFAASAGRWRPGGSGEAIFCWWPWWRRSRWRFVLLPGIIPDKIIEVYSWFFEGSRGDGSWFCPS